MRTPAEIKALAYERLDEAKILCDAAKYDGAFYLAGYSVELMLKAKVCERLGIDNLFDESCQIYGIAEVRKALKTHDLAVLFIFSGLHLPFEQAKSNHFFLAKMNGLLFARSGKAFWSEQSRYLPAGTQNPDDVQMFIELLQHEEGLLEWISNS